MILIFLIELHDIYESHDIWYTLKLYMVRYKTNPKLH
jgi:hypothetical protein